ncbi:glycosyl transferase group 1 [Thermocrinis albus DSM 14484]|uniref:Glycosyl transferase group 1 n=1 Tax=Thermocrinis albus (strain DSM 14484 / JCM 11386 / HI 11/12) TaxID=638303 RepID=D3SNN7_THEAH|nr:glycosyltransferase [Thermocrinis albus]ADC88774.1 glycosyl transferase group 1 [Thermocrinis albus DSM 14484]
MKIAIVSNNTFSIYGGYEKVTSLVLKTLKEKYHCEVFIISVPHYVSLLNKPPLEIFTNFPIYRDSDYESRANYITTVSIKRFLGKDLLMNLRSLKQAFSGLPYFDIALVTDPLLLNSTKVALIEKGMKAKVVYWDHGSLFGYLRGKIQKVIYEKEILKGIFSTDAFLCISSEICDFVKGIKPSANTYLVYNPVMPYEGPLIKRSAYPNFVYVGRLTDSDKNISFLLKGLSMLKDRNWELIIIGTGPDEQKLKNLASKLGISERIRWLGFKEDPFSHIEEATALVLTSRWEGFPMVLVEANQRGIPVISSDCRSGPKDIVINGVNGYLYREGDIKNFLEVISGVIDGRLKFDTPENIAKTTERFDADKVLSNIYNALQKIVGGSLT